MYLILRTQVYNDCMPPKKISPILKHMVEHMVAGITYHCLILHKVRYPLSILTEPNLQKPAKICTVAAASNGG